MLCQKDASTINNTLGSKFQIVYEKLSEWFSDHPDAKCNGVMYAHLPELLNDVYEEALFEHQQGGG